MRRFRVSELMAGFLLGFAFLLVILLFSSDIAARYEVCETTKDGAKECARYGVVHFALHEIGAALDSYNGLITAIATAFIAWFTWSLRRSTDKLWVAGERQFSHAQSEAKAADFHRTAQYEQITEQIEALKESAAAAEENAGATRHLVQNAERTSVSELRAYVTIVVGTAIYQERERNLRFEAKPLIVNTGRTPAHNLGFQATAAIMAIPLPDDFDFPIPAVRLGGAMLGPGQNFVMKVPVSDFVDDAEIPAIKQADGKALCVWGLVTYTDAFGRPRETRFSQILSWLRDDSNIDGHYTQQHNSAT
jgi:hypothetical protein